MATAAPNLWDQSEAGKINKLEGINSLRPFYSQNDPTALANQSRVPGMQAQLGQLAQYQATALGQAPPSAAQIQLQQQGMQQQQQAQMLAMRGRGGNLQGMQQQGQASQVYGAHQQQMQMQQLKLAEQQQAQAAMAQMGGQMYAQGLGYDQMALQQALGGDQNALGWYAAQRGFQQQQDASSKAFITDMVKAGAGVLGATTSAATQIAEDED